jgi:electron transfer flavoprotein beta subunit
VNIVVAMKQIPDLQQIRIRNRQPLFDDVPLTLGTIDKNALEAAVVLKEADESIKVTVLSAGNEEVEDTVKEALAAGADEAFLILDDALEGADSAAIAAVLAAAIKQMEDVDLILFGEGSGDNYSGQVGSRVAELLNMPQAGYVSALEIKGGQAIVTRTLEDCDEVMAMTLPGVISVMSGLNEPRIPSVTQILKAGKKPKEVLELDEVDLDIKKLAFTETIGNLAPESNRKKIVVKSVDELLQGLRSENLIGR